MKDYSLRNDKIKLINASATSLGEHMIELFENGYDQGYEDGKADTPFTDTEEAENKAYNRGLNDVWKVIKKITDDERDGGYPIKMLNELFGSTVVYNIVHDYTPKEALAKIKEYENKQKQDAEIKIGYEVYNLDRENKRIVTAIDGNKAIQLCSNGNIR